MSNGDSSEIALERARRYARRCDPAVSGQGGHNQTYNVACKLVIGFNLDTDTALELLLTEYNPRCQPPWSDHELRHKVDNAAKEPGERGYLLASRLASSSAIPTAQPLVPATPLPKPKVEIKIETVDTFLAKIFPEPRWAVPGILPEGCAVLAGRPKTGKSWMSLSMALSVASGGLALGQIPVEQGEVLYLALEDGDRRLQDRLRKQLAAHHMQPSPLMRKATQWPRHSDGGLHALEKALKARPATRLVVIDTLARIRDKRQAGGSIYEEDYASIAYLKDLGDRYRCCCLILHHTRKGESEDPLEDVSGTMGLTGAADAVLVLRRARHSLDAKLHITGRDVEEKELALKFDPQRFLWQLTDDPGLPPEQAATLEVLRQVNRPLTILEIAALTERNYDAAKKLLKRMYDNGLIVKRNGAYTPAGCTPGTPGDSCHHAVEIPE